MSNRVAVIPSWAGGLAFWAGSDDYSLKRVIRRAPLFLPVDRIIKVYEIESKSLVGLDSPSRFAIEYNSKERHCFITLQSLPEKLNHLPRQKINPPGAALLFFKHSWREPTALLLPFLVPFIMLLMMMTLEVWDHYVLHNPDILAFFSKPGCDLNCVHKILSIHSMVGLVFLIQTMMLLLPMAVLLFQAPKYRSALNYRMIQSYSLATILVGLFVFGQWVAFFPFKHYGKFVEMGFDPKVERMLENLKTKGKK